MERGSKLENFFFQEKKKRTEKISTSTLSYKMCKFIPQQTLLYNDSITEYYIIHL